MSIVLTFGEALIDFHARAPKDPQQLPVFIPHPGGAPANVAVAVSKLGAHSTFIGMLGADLFGDLLLKNLRDAGVDTAYVARTDRAKTALAFVSHDANGERSFSFYRPPAADLLFEDSDFRAEAFADAAVFHACSNSLTEAGIAKTTISGMQRARAAGALVSFDMNLRPALWPVKFDPTPRLWEALLAADLVKLSAEELTFLADPMGGEKQVLTRLWQGRTHLLVVTDGDRPLRWFTPQQAGSLPAFSVAAVDTTGAGDAFVGGLIYRLAEAGIKANGLTALVDDAATRDEVFGFANACGALAVRSAGSFSAMPDLETAQAFVRSQA